MIFVLDNYDSFTWNLVQYLGELGTDPMVTRNDQVEAAGVLELRPEAIVISPGPGTPSSAGIALDLIRAAAAARVPLLGVCLGHQAIGEAFGGRVVRAERQMHGKVSEIRHNGTDLFQDLINPLPVMRYHSLIVEPATLPVELEVTAWSDDRPKGAEIMALRHRTLPIWGVQFHPESVGTPLGLDLLRNFLKQALVPAQTVA